MGKPSRPFVRVLRESDEDLTLTWSVAISDTSGLTVRPAEATQADGALFARLLDLAQEGWYRIALGSSAIPMVASVFMQRNHELSFEFVTIAERGDEPVAVISAYSGRDQDGFATDPLDQVAAGRFRYRAMKRFTARTLSFMALIPEDDFYVRALAVDPEHRGQGIGTLLLDAAAAQGKGLGCRRIALDVAATNDGAKRLYERMGMVQQDASPRYLGLPRTNLLRMVKGL